MSDNLLQIVPVITGGSWDERANCQGTDPEVFYPEKGGSSEPARRICRRCPVRLDCLEDALARREKHGIWGGLSENQRTSLLRRRATQAAERQEKAA